MGIAFDWTDGHTIILKALLSKPLKSFSHCLVKSFDYERFTQKNAINTLESD